MNLNKNFWKYFLLIQLYFSVFINLFALTNHISFEHISVEQGLSNGTIYSIIQDEKGFLWFGTPDGLNKFDGYDFTVYKHDPVDPFSISNNNAGNILIDSSGFIWIGTWGGGLNKFDPKMEKAICYTYDPKNPDSISDNRIQSLYQDSSGTFWFGTYEGGLNKLVQKDTTRFIHFKHDAGDPNSLSHNRVWAIVEDNEDRLWIATSYGLNRFDPKTEQFTHYYHDPDNPQSISSDHIRTLFRSASGTIWIGTQNGLNRFDPETEKFTRFLYDAGKPAIFGLNTISSIIEDSDGKLWVGSAKGLIYIDPETGAFKRFLHDAHNPSSLSADEIRCIYKDLSGILWIGTLGGGINKCKMEPAKFIHYFCDPDDPNSLSHNYVRAIYEDKYGMLWVGTRDGLNKINKASGKCIHYRHDPNKPGSISHNEIWCIYEDSNGILWIGTRNGGLNKFDRAKGVFTQFQHDPDKPGSISRMGILSIYEDRQNTFWIGAYTGGLYQFDPETGKFINYRYDTGDPNSISHNEVWCVFEDSSNNLWIGTGKGLNKLHRETGRFEVFQYSKDDIQRSKIDRVFNISENEDSILWICSDTGLHKFDVSTSEFIPFTEKDGLPNNRILGILEDNDEKLWLSTNNGISKFDPEDKTFRNYDVDDGLQSREFNPRAFYKNSKGEMFFGGVNGFNSFFPERIIDNPHIPPIVITNFKLFNNTILPGKDSPLKRSISYTDEIVLSHKDYVFSFEFTALDFVSPEKNKYAYKMEGFNEEWIYADADKRFAPFANLTPGKYIFKVIGSNNDDVWNEEGASIKITIIPPFWATLWFKIFLFFSFLGTVYAIYKWRIRRIETKKNELEDEVKKRTSELVEVNKDLEAHRGHLKLINTILRHDLTNKLAVITSALRLYKKTNKKELLEEIIKHTNSSIELIDRMKSLETYIFTNKNLKICDLKKIINEIRKNYSSIDFNISGRCMILADESLNSVIDNVVENAVVHGGCGKINIKIEREDGLCIVRIADDGIGIPDEVKEKIFEENFIYGKSGKTGLGLFIARETMNKYNASIYVEDNIPGGSVFILRFKNVV